MTGFIGPRGRFGLRPDLARNAVIEFPSYQAALDCWKSPEYQQAIKLRRDVSAIDLIVVEGYEGPQPGCRRLRRRG
jgi:hypothetical protein